MLWFHENLLKNFKCCLITYLGCQKKSWSQAIIPYGMQERLMPHLIERWEKLFTSGAPDKYSNRISFCKKKTLLFSKVTRITVNPGMVASCTVHAPWTMNVWGINREHGVTEGRQRRDWSSSRTIRLINISETSNLNPSKRKKICLISHTHLFIIRNQDNYRSNYWRNSVEYPVSWIINVHWFNICSD